MPTIKTARLGVGKSVPVNHFTGVRVRVVGSGELEMTLSTEDDVRSVTLTPFTMASSDSVTPFRLANLVTQRAQLQITTDLINEIFRINRIIIYAKPVENMYPG